MVEVIKTERIRVNYDVSTKGVVTPSITVEISDTDYLIVLKKAEDVLIEAMKTAKRHSKV